MPLFLAFICIFVYALVQKQKRKELEKHRAPVYAQYERENLEYMLTWMIFQDVIQEVYDEWSRRGAQYPIGVYHETFRQIGRELYSQRTPTEEAVVRAKTYLRSIGYNCRIPGTVATEASIYTPKQVVPITNSDFQFQRPDRIYYPYLHRVQPEQQIYYHDTPILELEPDDWRRTHYLASDGTRHPLRQTHSAWEETPHIQGWDDNQNW